MGKSAVEFLKSLKEKGQLPGLSKNDKGTTDFEADSNAETVNCRLQKNNDSSIYYYTISRAFKDSQWKLQKAWQTDSSGRTIKKFPVP
jgi:hypothetical protein